MPYYFKRDLVDGKVNWTPMHKMNVFGKYSVMIAPGHRAALRWARRWAAIRAGRRAMPA